MAGPLTFEHEGTASPAGPDADRRAAPDAPARGGAAPDRRAPGRALARGGHARDPRPHGEPAHARGPPDGAAAHVPGARRGARVAALAVASPVARTLRLGRHAARQRRHSPALPNARRDSAPP